MPSSVQATEGFEVRATQSNCWEFFSNIENIGSCIPGMESVARIDQDSALFKVKLKVGYLSRTFELKAKIVDVAKPDHLGFHAEGNDAEISGTVDISPAGSESSLVRYSIEITPTSVTGKTAVAMIGKDLVKNQATEFAGCVKKRLET